MANTTKAVIVGLLVALVVEVAIYTALRSQPPYVIEIHRGTSPAPGHVHVECSVPPSTVYAQMPCRVQFIDHHKLDKTNR